MSNDFPNVFIFSILDPVACDLDRKSIFLDKWGEVEFGLYMVAGIFTASGRTCYQMKVRQRKTNLKIGRSPGAPSAPGVPGSPGVPGVPGSPGAPGAPSSPSTHLVHSPVKKSNRWPCQARNAQDHLREFHIWFDNHGGDDEYEYEAKPEELFSRRTYRRRAWTPLPQLENKFVSLTEWLRDPWIYDDRDKILV